MGMIVVGLMRDAHEARGLVRALDDEGFDRDDIDVSAGLLTELTSRGVPEKEAHSYAEGARRGGMLVCVRAEDDDEAAAAAELMSEHGAVDIDACSSGWQSEGWGGQYEAQPGVALEEYAVVFGEYPAAPGRIYHDPRASGAAAYEGPERREHDQPYAGSNRRVI
jgi:hypothetical protein